MLDSFGSLADTTNAVTGAAALGTAAKATLADGVMDVSLAGDGLNIVALSDDDDAAHGIHITGAAAAPTGLVINVGRDSLNLGDGASDLGPLSANQILFSFGGAATLSLRALAPESVVLAPLAAGKFSAGEVDSALVIQNYGSGPKDRFLAFNDPFSSSTLTQFEGSLMAATPEPASLALFAAGLAALAFAMGRGRRRSPS
jgi:choice-of-anchor A domain-containing protein